MIDNHPKAQSVDVFILAEGTYPFVRGGVAGWIYEMVLRMPDIRFGILFLGAQHGMYDKPAYPIPPNVVHVQMLYLFEYQSIPKTPQTASKNASVCLHAFHENLSESHHIPQGFKEPLPDFDAFMSSETGFDAKQFMRSEAAWSYIVSQYQEHSADPNFLNYFWNIRNMHEPLWNLHAVIHDVPEFKVLHPVSTGYAGLLAVMLKQVYQKPIILSEHGIYTRERNIELLQSSMISNTDLLLTEKKSLGYQHQLWVRFFESLARMAYDEASHIISLYEGARQQQILGGADAKKTQVIVNGIDIDHFKQFRRPLCSPMDKSICFVGRFVRIKDIKTFIRAIHLMHQKDATMKAWIKMVGEPDESYLEECMEYIDYLGLQEAITFVEEGGMGDMLMRSRLLILSSISEGMPLVALEAMAAGVPVITTDVGACRSMIEGVDEADKALGRAGAVSTIADANTLAQETLALLEDETAWQNAQRAAIKRVETYYNVPRMIARYYALYKDMMQWPE